MEFTVALRTIPGGITLAVYVELCLVDCIWYIAILTVPSDNRTR